MHRHVGLLLMVFGMAACDSDRSGSKRWYSDSQVDRGSLVFARNCASCHGEQAQGLVADWKHPADDGAYPPPPLNGSAHAWHHSLPLLLEIVQQGGALYDGNMPGFSDRLSETEQYAVIAWFQSYWSDETYRLWQEGSGSAGPLPIPAPVQENSDG